MDELVKDARALPATEKAPVLPCRHIQALIRDLGTEDPVRAALTYYQQGRRVSRLSYGELVSRIRRLKALWSGKYAVVPGQRVALLSQNNPAFVTGALSLMALGAVIVPLNPADSHENHRYIIAKSGARLILHAAELGNQARSLAPDLVAADLDAAFEVEFREAQDVAAEDADFAEPVPAVMLYTSGTTGQPKGVLLSHDALLLNAYGLQSNFSLGRNTAHLCVLPLFHANAFGFSMMATYLSRGHLVLCEKFPLLSFWDIVESEQITVTSLTPALLRPLAKRGRPAGGRPLHVVSAAAPLPVDVARQFHERTGAKISQGYGLSECTNFATILAPNLDDDAYRHLMHDQPQTCIGAALPGTHVAVVDQHGQPLGPRERGEIVVRGGNVMLGYWQEAAKTKETMAGGHLHTGDQGWYLVHEGKNHYFISGRYKDLIIRLGENISPTNVESQLAPMRTLGDYAVVGFHNVHVGEEVGLWLDPRDAERLAPDVMADRIVTEVAKLPFFQRPKVVLIGPMNEAVTSVGKIRRDRLAKRFTGFEERHFAAADAAIVQWIPS